MNAMSNFADVRADRILRVEEVEHVTAISRATIYRKEAAGIFPRRVRLGANSVGWYESQVQRWLSDPMGYRS